MFAVLIPITLCWVLLIMAFGVWQRVQSGKPIAPRVPPGAVFGETMCSGRALGGMLRGLANANNCLIVVIDHGRMSVNLAFPFNLLPIPGIGGLTIDVPIADIARVTTVRRAWMNVLRFEFTGVDRVPIELMVRNEAHLIAALGPDFDRIDADRPLQNKTGARADIRVARVFVGILGAGFLIGSGVGLSADLAVRAHGHHTIGTITGFADRKALVQYRVDGVDYTVPSQFNGVWQVGQTETLIYLPDHPDRPIENGNLLLISLFMAIGTILLSASLFGAKLLPGW